jgi:energy-coupling factor transporter transmembrane protein EcfT
MGVWQLLFPFLDIENGYVALIFINTAFSVYNRSGELFFIIINLFSLLLFVGSYISSKFYLFLFALLLLAGFTCTSSTSNITAE